MRIGYDTLLLRATFARTFLLAEMFANPDNLKKQKGKGMKTRPGFEPELPPSRPFPPSTPSTVGSAGQRDTAYLFGLGTTDGIIISDPGAYHYTNAYYALVGEIYDRFLG